VADVRNDGATPLIAASLVLLMPPGHPTRMGLPSFHRHYAMALGVLWVLVSLADGQPSPIACASGGAVP
jgi:hypothetical protein